MRAYRVKNKMKTPCRGVIGGVREIPPERKGRLKRTIAKAVLRRTMKTDYAINTAPVLVRATTVYDNRNLTNNGLIHVVIACLIFLIILIINN
jgi:hypothetical protein